MNLKFCYLQRITAEGALQAMSYKGKQWSVGEVIDIAFIGGTSKQRNTVMQHAEELRKYANVTFNWNAKMNKSDVRISFVQNAGAWSYIGTDAVFIPKNKATMNLGWLDKQVVLHEFCHMLGMGHEHSNPKGAIKWNRERVIKDLSGPPNNWDLRTIENNVLNAVNPATVDATQFDPSSIMLYTFPAEWTLDGKGTHKNMELSETDKAHLRKLYPITATTPRKITVIRRALEKFKSLW
jgi:hypothetical protein